MKTIKKVLCLILALSFVFCAMPLTSISASATSDRDAILAAGINKDDSYVTNLAINTPKYSNTSTAQTINGSQWHIFKVTFSSGGSYEVYTTKKSVTSSYYVFGTDSSGNLAGGAEYDLTEPTVMSFTASKTYIFVFPYYSDSYEVAVTGNIRYPANITVSASVPTSYLAGLKLDIKPYLSSTTYYTNFTPGFVTYSTSNSNYATVDGNGIVTFKSTGSVTITITNANDSSVKATTTFNVTAPQTANTSQTYNCTLESSNSYKKYYQFTAPSTDVYSFRVKTLISSDADYGYRATATVYTLDSQGLLTEVEATKRDATQYVGNVTLSEYSLTSGKKYYVIVSGYKSGGAINAATTIIRRNNLLLDNLNYLQTDGGTYRADGATRFETAIKAANIMKTFYGVDKFDTIVVASGANYPDALAGSCLCKAYMAPMLLASANESTNEAIYTYIEENLAPHGRVYILGGTAAVTEVTEDVINNLDVDNISVDRLAGADRYETNLKIVYDAIDHTREPINTLIIASGGGYADSLSASATCYPILLVSSKQTSLTEDQKDFIIYGNFSKVIIAGGTASVQDDVVFDVYNTVNYGTTVQRCSGQDRYETSFALAAYFNDITDGYSTVALASGKGFADGLIGGIVARSLDAPLLLVSPSSTSFAKTYYKNNDKDNAIVFGGQASVPDSVISAIGIVAHPAV